MQEGSGGLFGSRLGRGASRCLSARQRGKQARHKTRVPEGIEGVRRIHALVVNHAADPSEVAVGIETDRGLLVGALIGAGYQVYAVNPLAVSRYRERHGVSGAKSDHADAKLLADLVRTNRHNHARCAETPSKPWQFGSWPGPIKPRSGPASARPTSSETRCASSTLRRWRFWAQTWTGRWRSRSCQSLPP